jgi:hypothetical protein
MGATASLAPFLPLSCSERTASTPSHTPCILFVAGSRRVVASPVLKPSTTVTSATSISTAPWPSSTYFLCTSPSPPPHLDARIARGHRGPSERPAADEHHPTSPLRTSPCLTPPHRCPRHRGEDLVTGRITASHQETCRRRPYHGAANSKQPGDAPPRRP